MPKVSVLIPTYNYAHVLDEAIQSVFKQTFTDFELIIVDNHSKDNTSEVVKKYLSDKRVKYFQNEKNLGMVANWNKCLSYASGEYIKFLCSDDVLHPEILERYVPIMDENKNVSLITCHKQEFGDKKRLLQAPFSGVVNGNDMIFYTMKEYNCVGQPSLVMFRKKDIEKVGSFRNYLWITDWEMWVRLLTVGDCYIVPETLCYIRKHNQQVTTYVYSNLISRSEEFYFFKAVYQGKYNINFTGKEKELASFVKRKAERCSKDMYLIIPKLTKVKYWRSFASMFKIAAKEKVIFKPIERKIRAYGL